MSAPSWFRQAPWLLAAFLAAASALNYADRAAMSGVLAAVRTEFGASDVALGLLGSLFLWSYAVGSPLAGGLADRLSHRRIIIWSIAAWSAVTLATGLVNGFGPLLALRVGLGLTESLFLPAAIAMLALHHGPATRARAMSCISIGVNLGLVFGGTLSGFMAERWGWRTGFVVLGAAGLLLAWMARPFFPPEIPAPAATPPAADPARAGFIEAVRYLVRVPSYHALVLESMLSGAALWVFFNWLPLFFRDAYDLSLAGAGFAGTFMLQVSVVTGVVAGSWLSDRVAAQAPHRRMRLYGIFHLACAPFLLCFLGRPEFAVLAAGISAFSFLRGMGQANHNPTQCEIVPERYRATGVGIMNAVATGSGGCGVLMAGYLKREVGLEAVFGGISVVFALSGVILIGFERSFLRADLARAKEVPPAGEPHRTSAG